jgi:hypothetical protein
MKALFGLLRLTRQFKRMHFQPLALQNFSIDNICQGNSAIVGHHSAPTVLNSWAIVGSLGIFSLYCSSIHSRAERLPGL